MNRRSTLIAAAGTATVLCHGSYAVASAALKPAALTATQAISACADGNGYLRLAATSDKCASGTTKVGLARSSTAPQALALYATSGAGASKTLSLIANTQLVAHCDPGTDDEPVEPVTELAVVHDGKTQIDGTSFVVENGAAAIDFYRNSGGLNATPPGADSVYSTQAGGFSAAAQGSTAFATASVHLLVTVPGAVFTIDAVIDANAGTPYCRVSAEVESAATT